MSQTPQLRAKRSNLLILRDCFVALLLAMTSYSQDTINFKLFDSLKTSAEDSHVVIAKRRQIDSSNRILDTAFLKTIDLDSWPSKILSQQQYDSLKALWEDSYKRHISQTQITKTLTYQDPDNFDVRLFRTINNARSPFKDKFFNVCDRSMLPVSLILPASLFAYGRAKEKTYDENTAYLLASAEFTNMVLTFATKFFVNRKRPLEALPNVHTKGMPRLDVYSFPSGHASTTFSIATMFALRYPKYPLVYAPMYAYALIVAYGRPYFGMHYPSDLLAGAVYGAGSSVLIYSLRKELFKFKNNALNENKNDNGSIQAGTVTFFAGSFIASALVNTFIFKPSDTKRLFVSPWINDKTGGLRVDWRF